MATCRVTAAPSMQDKCLPNRWSASPAPCLAAASSRQQSGNCPQFSTSAQRRRRSVLTYADAPAFFQGTLNRVLPENLLRDEWEPGIPWAQMPWHVVLRALQALQKDESSERFFRDEKAPALQEVHSNQLEVVEGHVPACLDGVYIRTGPNPQHKPAGGYLLVDGEAMVHAVVLRDGKALSYANHWLRCDRFLHEQRAGRNIYLRIGDLMGLPGLLILALTQLNPKMFPQPEEYLNYQLGNTSLTMHNGKLLALMEGGMPFELKVQHQGPELGAVESVGPYDFDGSLAEATSGHPKVCPRTGELHSFFYRVAPTNEKQHFCVYHVASPCGKLSRDYPVPISRGQMMHDFAITENYAIFLDHAMIFDPENMVKNNTMAFRGEYEKPSRIGLLKRSAPNEPVQWFEVDPFIFFHTGAAWEEGSKVHLVFARYKTLNLNGRDDKNLDQIAKPARYTLDVSTGKSTQTILSEGYEAEFPVFPAHLVTYPCKYTYMIANTIADREEDTLGMRRLIKLNNEAEEGKGIVAELEHGGVERGGEFVFAPRATSSDASNNPEDDGWLVGFTTDLMAQKTYCVVYDAKTMSSEPVAKVAMPQRVPQGFHGLWVPNDLYKTQDASA